MAEAPVAMQDIVLHVHDQEAGFVAFLV